MIHKHKELFEMEQQAKQMLFNNRETACDMLRDVAQKWRDTGNSDFSFASYLRCSRKAGEPADALIAAAVDYLNAVKSAPYTSSALGWIYFDALKALEAQHSINESFEFVEKIFSICHHNGDNELLLDCTVGVLAKLVKHISALRDSTDAITLFEALLKKHEKMLSQLPTVSKDGRISPAESLYYAVRRAAQHGAHHPVYERYMNKATEDFPRNEWFASASINLFLSQGNLDSAKKAGDAALLRLPGSEAVLCAAAAIEEKLLCVDDAIELMKRCVINTRNPWPWQQLALLYEKSGELQMAADAYGAGLSLVRRKDAAKAWKLYHSRSAMLLALGMLEEAAVDACLGTMLRQNAGWKLHRDQKNFFENEGKVLQEMFSEMSSSPDLLLKQADAAYRRCRDRMIKGGQAEGKVLFYNEAKGFGMVSLTDGSKAFLPRNVLKDKVVHEAEIIHVICVDAFDKKRQRMGKRVVKIFK